MYSLVLTGSMDPPGQLGGSLLFRTLPGLVIVLLYLLIIGGGQWVRAEQLYDTEVDATEAPFVSMIGVTIANISIDQNEFVTSSDVIPIRRRQLFIESTLGKGVLGGGCAALGPKPVIFKTSNSCPLFLESRQFNGLRTAFRSLEVRSYR